MYRNKYLKYKNKYLELKKKYDEQYGGAKDKKKRIFKHYKNTNLKAILTAMDVDHIDSAIKGTPEGEQPNNYQLLCKMCHIIKSYDEGDYVNKKYKKDLES